MQRTEVGLLELFELEHFAFAAIGAVASDKLWTLIYGQALKQSFEARSPIRGAVPVACLQLGIEHQTQVAYPVGVDDVAGASGLLRVVAHHCAVLVAIEHLDGGVTVQYPAGFGDLTR